MLTILYVGGVGRSGTTLFGRLLDRVDGVVGLGEVATLWTMSSISPARQVCACGQTLDQCDRWAPIGAAIGGWDEFARRTPVLRSAIRHRRFLQLVARNRGDALTAEADEVMGDLWSAIASTLPRTGRGRLVEGATPLSGAASIPEVDLRLVHMVPDSRGVASSWARCHLHRSPRPVSDAQGCSTRTRPAGSLGPWVATTPWAAIQCANW